MIQNAPTWADVVKVFPALALFFSSLIPITVKVFNKNREQAPIITLFQALIGVGVAIFATIRFSDPSTAFSESVVIDGLSYWSNLIILAITGFTLCLSFGNLSTNGKQFSEHVFLILNSVVGMLVITWSNDLVLAFIGIELMSLAFYVLAGLSPEQIFAKEAAFKYFILGSFGSAFFLYGSALVFGTMGTTSIATLAEQGPGLFTQDAVFAIGIALILVGLFFKVSIFPFHAWAPDVYQGSPTPVTAFMSTAGKLVAFVLLIKIFGTQLLSGSQPAIDALQWLAVMTMLVGNFMALRQENFKRMLGFSSVAHSGYALVGIIAASISETGIGGASAVLYYFLAYGLMNIGAFAIISLLEKTEGQAVLVDDVRGLGRKHPWLAASLTICLLSLAGIPPTAGFFGKFYIFSSAIQQGLVWLTVWGVINSALGVYYYLRPVLNMYMRESDGVAQPRKELFSHFCLAAAAVGVVALGIFAEPVIQRLGQAIVQVFG
ncbi:MAG: NADH-quinone oxidoreductase subunit N [Bdellovibrionales bacterium]|nr:NADH-quinone oxidoreductase subunit N [Bdellovibrionales bacterium]